MRNQHNIKIQSLEELETLSFFASRAAIYENKKYTSEYERVLSKQTYDIIPLIIKVSGNGYVVLEDGTIRCTDSASPWIAEFDGCLETEMFHGFDRLTNF